MKIKKGDILTFRNDGLLSWAIRLVTTGKFGQDTASHVAIVQRVDIEGVWIIHATSPKVKISNLKEYRKYKIWRQEIIEPCDIVKGLAWAEEQQGVAYDFLQGAGLFFRAFLRILGSKVYKWSRKVRNFLDSKQDFICSEFASFTILETGKTMPKGIHLSQITPHDLHKANRWGWLTKPEEIIWDDIYGSYYYA